MKFIKFDRRVGRDYLTRSTKSLPMKRKSIRMKPRSRPGFHCRGHAMRTNVWLEEEEEKNRDLHLLSSCTLSVTACCLSRLPQGEEQGSVRLEPVARSPLGPRFHTTRGEKHARRRGKHANSTRKLKAGPQTATGGKRGSLRTFWWICCRFRWKVLRLASFSLLSQRSPQPGPVLLGF